MAVQFHSSDGTSVEIKRGDIFPKPHVFAYASNDRFTINNYVGTGAKKCKGMYCVTTLSFHDARKLAELIFRVCQEQAEAAHVREMHPDVRDPSQLPGGHFPDETDD